MAAIRVLIALLAFSVVASLAQQCDQAFEDFHQCVKGGAKKPEGGQKPDFKDLKAKADKCFTDNGCEAPKFPGAGEGAPSGGRAGRVGAGKGGAGNDDKRKCFEAVHNKTRQAMNDCMRKADPTFTPPTKGPKGGQSGEGGHRGGHGGPHGGFGGGKEGGQKFVLDACKNSAANAQKVNACLTTVFPKHQAPSQDQMRQAFDARCKTKAACEAKLGACKQVMEKRAQAMCTCSQQTDFQTLLKSEPACAGVQQPQGGGHGGQQGGDRKPHDCTQKRKDPCEEGFDAFIKNRPQHGGPGQH